MFARFDFVVKLARRELGCTRIELAEFEQRIDCSVLPAQTFERILLLFVCESKRRSLEGLLARTVSFGALKLNDLKPRVLIASFSLDNQAPDPLSRTWNPKFFHNFPGTDSDGGLLVVDVAMSTSAAPTYFPSYGVFIDGGVIANNPSMAAIAQALDVRNPAGERATLGEIKLLSVGTGASLQYIAGQDHDWGDAQWIKPILNVMMDGSVGVSDFECRQLLGDRYCRIEPVFPPGKSFPLDDVSKIVDLMDLARSYDLRGAVAWLKNSGW